MFEKLGLNITSYVFIEINKKKDCNLAVLKCGEPDLNRHSLRHQHLKLACLPIPPSPHCLLQSVIILYQAE